MVALLVNKDWLIRKAQQGDYDKALFKLLQNDALSIPYKQYLFTKLKADSPQS